MLVKLPILRVATVCGAVALVCSVIPSGHASNSSEKQELQTVSSVDLNRYVGDWYEIARTPNRYEAHCVADVKVHYELLPDGRMGVKNECRQSDGKTDIAHARASVVDTVSRAKLRMTFFWPFFADYWIIDLDKDYRYAVVGEPDRKYLWIISRTPRLDMGMYQELLKHITEHGYDISKVQKTEQTEATGGK
jgi:apolipoprotein D and lipocalin family protein